MAHTFSQIYIQAVFAVAARQSLIEKSFKEELQKYISGIIRKRGQKRIVINCMPDHAHLLIGLKPNATLSDLVRDVKSDSTEFLKRRRLVRGDSIGKKALEHFRIRIRNWTLLFGTFRIRKSTTLRVTSEMST